MKSKKIISSFYLMLIGALLVASQCKGMSSAAIKKGKRLQGMLTQSLPTNNTFRHEEKTITTHVDSDSLDSLIESTDESSKALTQANIASPKSEQKVPEQKRTSSAGDTSAAPVAPPVGQEAKEKTASSKPKETANTALKKNADAPVEQKTQEKKQPEAPKSSKAHAQEIPSVEFHFENTDLKNVVAQIAEIFEVVFISDDMVSPPVPGAKSLAGNKISFKTNKPLTKKAAWDLFLTFLDLAGFAAFPHDEDPKDPNARKQYQIKPIESAQKASLRSFIGVDPAILPNNDELIRYVYFIENSSLDAIKSIVETLKPVTAPFVVLQESKAFILVDKSYNIKSLMQIIRELDKVNLPQTLSVLKLRRADATQVKELYDTLSNNDDKNISARLFPARKQPTSLYFPENTRIFAEPRTNTLILLGPADAIVKIEDFITKYIDVDPDKPYSPLKVYTLKYADAESVAAIMNNVTQFGRSTEAGKSGGVRGEDKYLKPMSFTPEKSTNRIIIRGDYEDYLKAADIIAKLDEPQAQVAIEILIVSLTLNETRQLGTQLRSKIPSTGLTNGPKFQTSGFGIPGQAIVENANQNAPGVQRLLGNLLSLIGATQAGSTMVSLGTDAFGVWGVFGVLESIANATVVSNPFFVTTNKTPAKVEVGTTRRVATAAVLGGGSTQTSQGDLKAALTVNIVPQINSDGMISLHLDIQYNNFTVSNEPTDATTDQRQVVTDAIVADKEVLAIGGLIQNTTNDSVTKVPILGDIPILGWLFKNKVKIESKSNILILVSTRIINPEKTEISAPITQEHINEYRSDLGHFERPSDRHDPVTRLFFGDGQKSPERQMNSFLFKRQDKTLSEDDLYTKEMSRDKRRKEAKKRKRLAKLRKKESEALLNSANEQTPKGISV